MATEKKDLTTTHDIEALKEKIEKEYILDEMVDAAWPLTIILIIAVLYSPLKRLLESFANNLGKAKEITLGGVSWKTNDLEQAVIDFEILKSLIITSYADEDIDPVEIGILTQKTRNMPSYIDQVSKEAKEKILIESMSIAGADGKIDPEEYVLFRIKSNSLDVSIERIDDLLIEQCLIQKITPPPQLLAQYEQVKKDYGAS